MKFDMITDVMRAVGFVGCTAMSTPHGVVCIVDKECLSSSPALFGLCKHQQQIVTVGVWVRQVHRQGQSYCWLMSLKEDTLNGNESDINVDMARCKNAVVYLLLADFMEHLWSHAEPSTATVKT